MKTLWSPPPGSQANDSRCAVRHEGRSSRTVLGVKGSLRRGSNRRAPDSSAPFRTRIVHDGRLRREPFAAQFLRLTKDENQVVVDKTS
jgi:hypothetical protein